MKQNIHDILSAHKTQPAMDLKQLSKAIESISDCADICTSCADACVSEDNVKNLTRCIRLNLDCADACFATAKMLLRQTDPDVEVITKQLDCCVTACRSCGDECDKHSSKHEHCRICAEACRECVKECESLLQVMPLT